MLGARGIAFMYVRNSREVELQPTATGWFAQADPHAMDIYHHQPHASARRFESGTPNAPGLFAAEAGLQLLLEVGLDEVAAQITKVTAEIKQAVHEHGWRLVTPPDRHGAMLAVRSNDAPALVTRLTARDIVVTERDSNIRIAPHFFNNGDDVARLISALQAESKLLATD